MKLIKSALLGTSAALATVVGAQAADLPSTKSAPVQYVRICDAYGAGFFYIPGTQTCLKVGGRVRFELSTQSVTMFIARLRLAAPRLPRALSPTPTTAPSLTRTASTP